MSREKQIEEMANTYYEAMLKARNSLGSMNEGAPKWYAKELYDAGYRKQSEGEWIDQYNGKYANPIYVCSLCGKGTLLKPDINELGNMEMIQALSSFCPNCGAKMKGGAE